MRFDEILTLIDTLPPADQEALLGILERRRIADRRAEITKEVVEAREEYRSGACRHEQAAEIMKDLLS
jgi:hypothetical protein